MIILYLTYQLSRRWEAMKLSKRTRYGFRLMLELAKRFDTGPVSIKEIAEVQDISGKFLEQIIIQLKATSLVKAVRGPKGGYMLSQPPSQITLKFLFEIFEGPSGIVECVQNPSECKKADYCLSRKLWVILEDNISQTLGSATLKDLLAGDPAGLLSLKSLRSESAESINPSRKRPNRR
jgi:Rrf2 family transcriptional regulator, cysteine metabolism repressor